MASITGGILICPTTLQGTKRARTQTSTALASLCALSASIHPLPCFVFFQEITQTFAAFEFFEQIQLFCNIVLIESYFRIALRDRIDDAFVPHAVIQRVLIGDIAIDSI